MRAQASWSTSAVRDQREKGDHVIPLYRRMPAVPVLPVAENQFVAPRSARRRAGSDADGTSRFSLSGKPTITIWVPHLANCTVCEIAVAENPRRSPRSRQGLLYRCGVTTGIGAVIHTAKVEQGAKAIVFGLGAASGFKRAAGPPSSAGADMIIGVDINNDRKAWGERFGMYPLRQSEGSRQDLGAPSASITIRHRPRKRAMAELIAAGACRIADWGPVDRVSADVGAISCDERRVDSFVLTKLGHGRSVRPTLAVIV